jgi:hypothetical protein
LSVAARVDAVHQSGREGILHPVDDADLVHDIYKPSKLTGALIKSGKTAPGPSRADCYMGRT